MTSTLVASFFLAISLCGCAHGAPLDETRKPKTELPQAVSKAEAYVAARNIDVSTMFVQRVFALHDVRDPSKTGWVVTWAPTDPYILDGEVFVYVYDNGRVESPE